MEEVPVLLRILPATVVLILLIAIVVIYITSNIQKSRKTEQPLERFEEFDDRMAHAVWAGADIVNIKAQNILEDATGTARIELSLLVQPPAGEAFQASTVWRVDLSSLSSVQPGQSVSVKIDQHDPQIIYPNVPWAQYWVWGETSSIRTE